MTRRVEFACAKINFGLEILGKRPDGYHEIRSILCRISLHDTITFAPSHSEVDILSISGNDPEVAMEDNLVVLALNAMRVAGACIPPQQVNLEKCIPAASGLGGASSNAAATLRAFAPELERAGVAPVTVGSSLGSDVPFFLNGAVCLASGRGERLIQLPEPPQGRWIILATPSIAIPAKTASMYAAVSPEWWSSGDAVETAAQQFPEAPATPPRNTFERALLRRFPDLRAMRESMIAAGAPFVALTGAGPTFYTMSPSERAARQIANHLTSTDMTVRVARLWNCSGAPA